MIRGLHHIGLTSSDAEALAAFYCRLFGGEVLRRYEWPRGQAAFDAAIGLPESAGFLVLVGFGAMRLEIFQFDEPALQGGEAQTVAGRGLTHVAFEVAEIEAEYQRLTAAGMAFNAPPLRMPAGGVFAYGRDPDGNIVELVQPPPAAP